jgi:tRNA (guanosine-2'-O-)-methyltransferase
MAEHGASPPDDHAGTIRGSSGRGIAGSAAAAASSNERSARRLAIRELVLEHPYAAEIHNERLQRMVDVSARRLSSLTVVLENLWSAHNFSAIVRSAEGLGLQTAHVIETLNRYRKSPGVAHGADRWLNVRRHRSLAACVDELVEEGFRVACADVGPGCVDLHEVPADRPIAVLLGSERTGLSDEAKRCAHLRFTIPMAGFTESFNVSVSAAISLYALQGERRRHLGHDGDLTIEQAAELVAGWLEETRSRRRRTHRS